jgi:hypothetical protein
MTMRTFLLSLTVLGLACTTPKEKEKDTTVLNHVAGKPGAPTQLTSKLGSDRAFLRLAFEGDGHVDSVAINGIRGTSVKPSGEVATDFDVKRGEVREFDVAFNGDGYIVVSVSGVFGGAKSQRVHSVMIGNPSKSGGETQTTDDGESVKTP